MTRSNTPQADKYLVVTQGRVGDAAFEIEQYEELSRARDAAERLAVETGNAVRVYQFNSQVEIKPMPQWQEAKRGE